MYIITTQAVKMVGCVGYVGYVGYVGFLTENHGIVRQEVARTLLFWKVYIPT